MKEVLYNTFTNKFFITSLIFAILVYIVTKFFLSKILGFFGELWCKQELSKLPKDKYKIINNLFINTNNTTHQIDHVVVSLYGIFVIETKQYNGYITGNKYDKKWIRHCKHKKYYYENPIRQNYGHVLAVCDLLHLKEDKVFNIVCIPSNAKLKIKDNGETQRNTTIVGKIITYNEHIIDNVDEIVNIIKKNNIKDRKRRGQHIKDIKNNVIEDYKDRCPKCGGELVQRESKYGKFLGCSNYPKCKYIMKTNNK